MKHESGVFNIEASLKYTTVVVKEVPKTEWLFNWVIKESRLALR